MLKLVILIFLIGLVSVVEVDLYYPDEIVSGKEFECEATARCAEEVGDRW